MNRISSTSVRAALAGALALLAAAVAGPAAAAIYVAVQPPTVNVAPGADIDLTLEITQAGSPFNSFTAIVEYDTTALTFVPRVPTSAQQGCLMTGLCSSVCGNTFHRFSAAGDSLAITDGLLCDQTAVTGPGTIYKLRFRASNTPQDTWVRLRRVTFVNAGVYVNPVFSVDSHIGIGVSVGVGPPEPGAGFSLRAEPNPARGAVVFALESDRPGPVRVEVHDLGGRLVRRFTTDAAAGVSRVRWDGLGAGGERVRPGVYLVSAQAGGRVARARVAILD